MLLPELLAPAGGMPQLEAALRFGADAVYGGLPLFGLRANAGNFDWDQLAAALEKVHHAGKKFYLTMNIYPYDDELDAFVLAAAKACEMGVDAAIVSDIGAFLRLRRDVPALPIHISTQANTLNAEACGFYLSQGAERVVLSRELTFERIHALRRSVPDALQLEAFVHGAMCMSYSGRCMLSDHLAQRGGNHGACAQPCRWHYALEEEKRPGEYYPIEEDGRGTAILSAYDLNMLAYLPQLIDCGIASLKIEGRMKTPYYVAGVVSVYRRALDLIGRDERLYLEMVPEMQNDLNKISHRASNTGFYFGAPNPSAGADGFSQSMEYCANVVGNQGNVTVLEIKNRFYTDDMLELLSPAGFMPFRLQKMWKHDSDESINTVSVAGTLVDIPLLPNAGTGDFILGPNRNHQ